MGKRRKIPHPLESADVIYEDGTTQFPHRRRTGPQTWVEFCDHLKNRSGFAHSFNSVGGSIENV